MTDEIKQRIQLLSSEIIEALGLILQKKQSLDVKTLSKGLLERPKVTSLLEETAAEKTNLSLELEEKIKELNELSAKYTETLKDLQHTGD